MGSLALAEDPLPKDWSPDLSEVARHLEKELQEPTICQAEMNRISAHLAEVRDVQLALLYFQLWQQLSAKEQTQLKNEQTAWIKKRSRSADKVYASYEGGTYAPCGYSEEFLKQTDLRIKELQDRLKQRSNKPMK